MHHITRLLVAVGISSITTMLTGCGEKKIAYRITVVVEVSGVEHKGSTVQNLLVFGTGDANGKRTINTSTEGVPAVMDLDGRGWLVTAAKVDWKEWKRRQETYGLKCKEPRALDRIVADAGGNNGTPAAAPTELPFWNMPAFVWFPVGQSYKHAVQLCAEEFARVIGPDVRLVSVSILEDPTAKAQHKLDVQAPWLEELRADRDNGRRTSRAGETYVFIPRHSNFEDISSLR